MRCSYLDFTNISESFLKNEINRDYYLNLEPALKLALGGKYLKFNLSFVYSFTQVQDYVDEFAFTAGIQLNLFLKRKKILTINLFKNTYKLNELFIQIK